MPFFRNQSRVQSLIFTTLSIASKPLSHWSTTGFQSVSTVIALNPRTHSFKNTNTFISYSSSTLSNSLTTNRYISSFRGGGSGASASASPIAGVSLKQSSPSEVNGESENNVNKQERKKGETGWNHNLPKETSPFWTKEESSTSSTSTTAADSSSKAQRTGWLHSKPKEKSEKKDIDNSIPKESAAQKLLRMAKLQQKTNHRIISPPTFHACGEGRRAVITENFISVPLDRYSSPSPSSSSSSLEEKIDIYFSIVDLITTPEEEAFFISLQKTDTTQVSSAKYRIREQQKRASDYKDFIALKNANECMLYLQGGPGFGAPQPINGIGLGDKSSWVGAALGKGYKRVVLMDQRGTGKSTTITKQTLEKKFRDLFVLDDLSPSVISSSCPSSMQSVNTELEDFKVSNPDLADKFQHALGQATNYMTHFRADNIVKDAEAVKDALLLPLEEDDNSPRPWGAALGQSFGGFCMMSYLSLIPNPPKICLLTGGIAPMLTNVDDVYHSLRERVKERNLKYYDRYPGDVAIVRRIVKRLIEKPASLPSGGMLTARRFLQVGISLGGSPSAFASLHSLFSSVFLSEDDDDFSRSFLKTIDSIQPFDDNPIYYLMHESIYADLNSKCKETEWSAMRAYDNCTDFGLEAVLANENQPVLLVGEVVLPWMSDGDYAELSGLSMRALAHSLASKNDWGYLYNAENMRKVLAVDGTGLSRAAAAVYYDDMYVDFNSCMKVTERGNPLENCKVFVTNEYQHSGLRDDGASIFCKLLGMARGEVGTPS